MTWVYFFYLVDNRDNWDRRLISTIFARIDSKFAIFIFPFLHILHVTKETKFRTIVQGSFRETLDPIATEYKIYPETA